MAVATPYIARNPIITLNAVNFECHARKISLIPNDDMTDVATFCNVGGVAPGATHWTCTISALQSFGPETSNAGLWETLLALRKTKTVMVIKPAGTVIGVPQVMATFTVWVPSIPFIDSDIGGSTIMDIEFQVVGDPVFATAA